MLICWRFTFDLLRSSQFARVAGWWGRVYSWYLPQWLVLLAKLNNTLPIQLSVCTFTCQVATTHHTHPSPANPLPTTPILHLPIHYPPHLSFTCQSIIHHPSPISITCQAIIHYPSPISITCQAITHHPSSTSFTFQAITHHTRPASGIYIYLLMD